MKKHTFLRFLALPILCIAAVFMTFVTLLSSCNPEVGIAHQASSCVPGPNTQGFTSDQYNDDIGCRVSWDSVPNAIRYIVSSQNKSRGVAIRDSIYNAGQGNNLSIQVPYTSDTIRFSVKPVLRTGEPCLPNGAINDFSRPNGGITVIILERTNGATCSLPNTVQSFSNNGFIAAMPITNFFSDTTNLSNSYSKLLNNAPRKSKVTVTIVDCNNATRATRTENVNGFQVADLTALKTEILAIAGRAGLPTPTTNTNAFIKSIEFRK